MNTSIAIVDYGMGNVGSVVNAIAALGIQAIVSRDVKTLTDATHIILPGVGSFHEGMRHLHERGLVEILNEQVLRRGKPMLGICLGMQMLANRGIEGGESAGLGFIPGEVRRFTIDETKFPVPHVGWNDLAVRQVTPLFSGITKPIFYFVHSYHLVSQGQGMVAATCDYSEQFVAAVQHNNIFGVQFHPEKSQHAGLALLQNFCAYRS